MLATSEVSGVLEMYARSGDDGESRAIFNGLSLPKCRFQHVSLACSDWINCDLRQALFYDCDLRGASFVNSDLTGAMFERCAMYDCELPPHQGVELLDCTHELLS